MFKKCLLVVTVWAVLLLAGTAVFADEGFFPWRGHDAPFDYRFGNLIDNHQQSKVIGQGMLQGFIYIQFTGEEIDGVPVAVRANCDDPALDCRVGWHFRAVPIEATLRSKAPRTWEVDPSALPASPFYSHFHWADTADFDTPHKPCKLQIDQTYPGFLMERTAVTTFYWLGGNPDKGHGGHLVTPGKESHSNIVTEWVPGSGGGCDGHDDGSDGGCDGHDGGSGGSGGGGGCDGHDDGSDGGCDGHDGTDGGCDGHDDGSDGGCDGHDGTDGGCDGH